MFKLHALWAFLTVHIFLLVIYRLASTPAMFNSTLTENDEASCPVDGSIMITGKYKTHSVARQQNL